jgi:hypothetical protein
VARVGRSSTLSGIGPFLHHVIDARSHQPSVRSANATIHGMPHKSFGFAPMARAAGRRSPWAYFSWFRADGVSRSLPAS